MQTYIDHALENFQPVFSRTSTWLLFCAIVMGFMGAGDIMTISGEIDDDQLRRLQAS